MPKKKTYNRKTITTHPHLFRVYTSDKIKEEINELLKTYSAETKAKTLTPDKTISADFNRLLLAYGVHVYRTMQEQKDKPLT